MRSASAVTAAAELVPFVPRLTVEWLQNNPELRWVEQEGTLAFIDISGFTAMSERLSNSGRAGAGGGPAHAGHGNGPGASSPGDTRGYRRAEAEAGCRRHADRDGRAGTASCATARCRAARG